MKRGIILMVLVATVGLAVLVVACQSRVEPGVVGTGTGHLPVQGPAADGSAVTGYPVLVGGVYVTSTRALDNGDVGYLAVNSQGQLMIEVASGSLDIASAMTVNDPVTVTQTTHDDLNANANLQVSDADVSATNPVPVRGGAIVIAQTPTISTTAYAANDAVGGKLTFANAVRTAGGVGYIEDVVVVDNDKENAELVLVCFDADFTATADNAAFDPSDADLGNAIGFVWILTSDYKSLNDNSVATVSNQPLQFQLAAGGTSLYCQLMAVGTPTYTATSDLTVKLAIRYVN